MLAWGTDSEYIWKSFSQGGMSEIKNQDDTGLGLLICKSLTLSISNSLLETQYDELISVDVFDTFDEGTRTAKRYEELHNQLAYNIVFISLYENNYEKASLELRLEINSKNLLIIFIVFPNNEGYDLAKKLVKKVEGATSILYTPITLKILINQFTNIEKR
ncbi:4773_t:CDS:2, partial [Scutellospora calospora]